MDRHHNGGLPPFLAGNGGVESGLMIAQYTAAALVSENKVLVHPASADSIPTSANQEDHVSMGTIAARQAREVAANVARVLAIELLCATRALEFRQAKAGRGTEAARRLVLRAVGRTGGDRALTHDIEDLAVLVRSGAFAAPARLH